MKLHPMSLFFSEAQISSVLGACANIWVTFDACGAEFCGIGQIMTRQKALFRRHYANFGLAKAARILSHYE
ncbi:MAG: hypothetical protein K6E73_09505 [Bacteroidales bacterium]|nr:hypothetical protein [Bacteroidales bacterium]